MLNSKFLTLIMPYDSFSKEINILKIIPTKKSLPFLIGEEYDR